MRGQLESELPKKKAWRPRTSRQVIDAVWRVDEPVDDRRSSVVDNTSCSPWHPIFCRMRLDHP
jgi:hypothetical protein